MGAQVHTSVEKTGTIHGVMLDLFRSVPGSLVIGLAEDDENTLRAVLNLPVLDLPVSGYLVIGLADNDENAP